jgi:Tfp pilus assembly protein PilO
MNKQLTKKQKFAISIAVWLMATLGMFFYCLPIQHKGNLAIIETIKTLSVKEQGLLAEKKSYLQAQKALEDLAKLEIQPENFFSKNITLVKEIKKLERIASELGVEFALSGISGNLQSATKAPTVSNIFLVPYSIHLEGSLDKLVAYIEHLENLEYITAINSLDVSATNEETVNLNLSANFYVIK